MARLIKREFDSRPHLGAEVYVNQWISFYDSNGRGHAQPDVFIVLPQSVICIECKLTQSEAGLRQISDLYRPLLAKIYGTPVVGVVACRRLIRDPGRYSIRSVLDVVDKKETTIYTWFWLGR